MTMFDVCVIGAGTIGSSAAYHLSKVPDLEVCLVGPAEPESKQLTNEVFGCHYDEGRITRVVSDVKTEQILAYRSTQKYQQLEQESGLKVFTEVGFGTVGCASDEVFQTINSMADVFCESNGMKCVVLDETVAREKWSFFSPPDDCTGRFVKELNGHISIRNLVRACQLVSVKNGVVRKDTIARSLTRNADNNVEIHLGDGTTIFSKKVILACGSFINFFDLLEDKKVDLRLTGHTVMKFEISNQDYAMMADFPSMIYRYSVGQYVYILPPIMYPNGKKYVKLGHSVYMNDNLSKHLHTLEEVKQWYCMPDYPDARNHFEEQFNSIFPNVSCLSKELDHCVMAMTKTGKQYIGFSDYSNIFVAVGGNGKTAKMALEIGFICSESVVTGKWAYDLEENDFIIVYSPSNRS